MAVTLFKRYKMEIDLRGSIFSPPELPQGYELLPWREELLQAHATAKFRSFSTEMDSSVFACLGNQDGCRRLMQDIATRSGFIPGATWLMIQRKPNGNIESCGTIQGVQTEPVTASIQNIGITPAHRGKKLGSILIHRALKGFREHGMAAGNLEVTALNTGAIRLYERLGFRVVQIVYKTAEFENHW